MRLFLWGSFVCLGLLVLFYLKEILTISKLDNHYPVVYYQNNKKPPKVLLQKYRPASWTSLHKVSKVALAAIIISEDSAFYQHNGYDLEQIKKAIEINFKKGRYVRGASTITQQTVKNILLSKNKSLLRKSKELLLSLIMEQKLSKQRILELYINIAEWGDGIFGIYKASHHYFSKDPEYLTAKEGAFLATLLPSPKRYSRILQAQGLTDFVEGRIHSILQKLTKAQILSLEDYMKETSSPLWIN